MAVRRLILLLAALAGSVVTGFVLYVTAEKSLTQEVDESTVTTLSYDEVSFPYKVKDSSIILQTFSAYEGPYLEDGTDDEVVDIAALHIYNDGENEISKVSIELIWVNGRYLFEGDHIPPGATVVLLEKYRGRFQNLSFKECIALVESSGEYHMKTHLSIREEALGTVIVTNLTDSTFYNVNVYHKSWLNPPDIYIGGISYKTSIRELLPGETVYLYPYHYACGYNKVVSVTSDRPLK